MEVGGLMAYVFKIFLGNPTIMTVLITWAVFISLLLTVIETTKKTEL